jgi:hypothetical protein
MPLDVEALAKTMLEAAKGSLAKNWKKVSKYAKGELERLASALEDIARLTAEGKLTPEEAASLLRIHKNTTIAVLAAAQGMALVASEKAINEAIAVVKTTVNKAAGVAIL